MNKFIVYATKYGCGANELNDDCEWTTDNYS